MFTTPLNLLTEYHPLSCDFTAQDILLILTPVLSPSLMQESFIVFTYVSLSIENNISKSVTFWIWTWYLYFYTNIKNILNLRERYFLNSYADSAN